MKRLKKAVCILLAGILAVGCAGQIPVCTAEAKASSNGKLTVNGEQDYKRAQEMLKLINQARKKAGLSTLKMDKTLTTAAITRAAELSVYVPQGSPHRRPNGKLSKSLDKRICYEDCAEDIGIYYYMSSPEMIFNNWMSSSSHKKGILLSSAKSVGIGCVMVPLAGAFWVLDFGNSKAKSVEKSKETVPVSKKIDVSSKYLKKAYFKFETPAEAIRVGESRELFLDYKNKYAYSYVRLDPSGFQWTSSKPSVATVSKKGVLKAKKAGTVKITAKLKTGTKVSVSIKLNVEDVM